ncbi:MAG: carboxypeptidase regulatory-like domain-containing protein [Candidatus Aminicenantales bacterium]
MKKALIVLAVLVFSMSLVAQQRTGNIYGKIVDSERNPLPGVTVTLTGPQMAPVTTVTSEVGIYRFPSIPPSSDYTIKAELQGFKTQTRGNIIVTIGGNSEINVVLEVGKLEEQVTVTAATPIVDSKRTATAMNVGKEEMQSLPTARDPWVIVALAPAVMIDRENVGGNESSQQAGFIGKGDITGNIGRNPGANNIFAVDGIDITDPAALGGSALYYDFDMFEELNITTGGAADVSIQTGGIALNMVTRRGGNKMSLAGRFYLTDNFFQSNNLTPALKAQGITNINKIQYVKDYGFNAGGPVFKDKLWWWGAYGVQDIFVYNMVGTADKTLLNNYNFKLNAQLLANNRFEVLVTSGAKEKYGRNASVTKPDGDHQVGKYHWGSPILKLQDEHVFGNNFYVSLKYSFNDAGFGWTPIPDPGTAFPIDFSQTQNKYIAYGSGMNPSWGSYSVGRPRNNYQINASYFNDTFLGLSHEIKIGAEYSNKHQTYHTGNFQGFDITSQYNSQQLDVNADGTRTAGEMAGWQRVALYRSTVGDAVANQYAGYLQDTMTKGKFTLTLGLRWDLQVPSAAGFTRTAVYPGQPAWDTVFDPATSTALASILPNISTHAVDGVSNILHGSAHAYSWSTWSPRIGLTWDVTGDGKTVAKLALSQYGDIMGVGWWANAPMGASGGLRYWWNDVNADKKMQPSEMFWSYWGGNPAGTRYVPYPVFADDSGTLTAQAQAALVGAYNSDAYKAGMYYSFDYFNPLTLDYTTGITDYFNTRSDQASTRTREVLLTLEREIIPDFSVALTGTYRRYDKIDYGMAYYPADRGFDGVIDPNGTDLTNFIRDPRTPPAGGWYVAGGTVPSTVIIGGVWTDGVNEGGTEVSTGQAAGRTYYLPGVDWPTTSTNYTLWRKSDAYDTYVGLDLVLTKRLSNKWFMNASFTWQDERAYWGSDWFDPTNKWMSDGQTFATNVGTLSGKAVGANMFTRWMVKLSGLYQLPLGFDISGTLNAREGWKVPHYFYIEQDAAPNYAAGSWALIYTNKITFDSLPTFWNLSLRLEKKINVATGRMYLMADVFNVFNNNMINRAYDAYSGDAYFAGTGQYDSWTNPTNRLFNEMLNPRIWRFGVRFEF